MKKVAVFVSESEIKLLEANKKIHDKMPKNSGLGVNFSCLLLKPRTTKMIGGKFTR